MFIEHLFNLTLSNYSQSAVVSKQLISKKSRGVLCGETQRLSPACEEKPRRLRTNSSAREIPLLYFEKWTGSLYLLQVGP